MLSFVHTTCSIFAPFSKERREEKRGGFGRGGDSRGGRPQRGGFSGRGNSRGGGFRQDRGNQDRSGNRQQSGRSGGPHFPTSRYFQTDQNPDR